MAKEGQRKRLASNTAALQLYFQAACVATVRADHLLLGAGALIKLAYKSSGKDLTRANIKPTVHPYA